MTTAPEMETEAAERRGIFHDLDEETYHRDPHSLSVSGMKTLLQAPALFRHEQEHPVFKNTFDFGSAAHEKVLGVGPEIVVVNADSWRTKAATEARDTARDTGKVALLAKDAAQVDAMAIELSRHRLASALLRDGRAEVSMFWHDDTWDITRRARLDWHRDDGRIVDYKSAVTADPTRLPKVAYDLGYFMQAANYLDVCEGVGAPAEDFVFIFQEKTAPYLVTVVRLDEHFVSLGRTRCARALEIYRDCLAVDLWPGYTDDLTDLTIAAPRWA